MDKAIIKGIRLEERDNRYKAGGDTLSFPHLYQNSKVIGVLHYC